uniref:helix-hairpin-helix domain-containing protein n=1 Tax=Promineifilum sp. TaxID=2664178 RepID=UPI0035B1C558
MNFWTGLILGLIIGWLVEWIIDWLFWRRDAVDEYGEQAPPVTADGRVVTAEAAEREAEWQSRLETAERDYQSRLATVEGEWQARLNLNEQQWQSQFRALESDNETLRGRLDEATAGAALAAAGAAVAGEVDAAPAGERLAAGDLALVLDESSELPHVTDLSDPDAGVMAFALPDEAGWEAERPASRTALFEAADTPDVIAVETADAPDLDASDFAIDATLAETVDAPGLATPNFAIDTAPAAMVEVSDEYDTGQVTPLVADVAARGDDLTRIRGIGPRFAAILAAGGIRTYDDLAAASPEQLRDIIKPGPMRQIPFELWNSQAAAFAATRAERVGDNLTTIEGIGPVYATKLRERGISTFADLAATDEATLVGIINAPAWRRVNYADWITQAQLAATGNQTGLSELQGRLFQRSNDNLTLIHGLGPRSAAALQAAGILSFADLAAASPDQVERIVSEAGVRGGRDY